MSRWRALRRVGWRERDMKTLTSRLCDLEVSCCISSEGSCLANHVAARRHRQLFTGLPSSRVNPRPSIKQSLRSLCARTSTSASFFVPCSTAN